MVIEKSTDISTHQPQLVSPVATEALSRTQTFDWPNTQQEEWRRTDLSYLQYDQYEPYDEQSPQQASEVPEDCSAFFHWEPGQMHAGTTSDDLVMGDLRSLDVGRLPAKISASLLRGALAVADNRLSSWHLSWYTVHPVIYIPPGTVWKKPLRLSLVAGGDNRLINAQTTVIVGEGAEVTIEQQISGNDEADFLLLEGINLHAAANARVHLRIFHDINLNATLISNSFTRLHRDTSLSHVQSTFGGMLSKYRLFANLEGPGSNVHLYGLYFPIEDQHIDMKTVQNHRSPHAFSRTLYKGIVSDSAHSIYQGLISVAPKGVGTDAYLTNNNILLSDSSRADSIPSLRIDSNDLRCSHGSTLGKLNETQIFYLQTRGFSREEAIIILIEAYFDEVLCFYSDDVADQIREIARERYHVA